MQSFKMGGHLTNSIVLCNGFGCQPFPKAKAENYQLNSFLWFFYIALQCRRMTKNYRQIDSEKKREKTVH